MWGIFQFPLRLMNILTIVLLYYNNNKVMTESLESCTCCIIIYKINLLTCSFRPVGIQYSCKCLASIKILMLPYVCNISYRDPTSFMMRDLRNTILWANPFFKLLLYQREHHFSDSIPMVHPGLNLVYTESLLGNIINFIGKSIIMTECYSSIVFIY